MYAVVGVVTLDFNFDKWGSFR